MGDWPLPLALMQNLTLKDDKQTSDIKILHTSQLDDLYSLSHPYLSCLQTIEHIRQTKVMFIMRGLPGSGKSTVVDLLKKIYSKSFIVCSADHYFIDSHGNYNFNRDKIVDAHRECQQHADNACKNNVLCVIIDNTNIQATECKTYFQKASNYGYAVIIVEPRTDWKRDANELNSKNKHNVPIDVIEARLNKYHPMIPTYFGLFLNQDQSSYVLQQAYDYYQQALQIFPQLKRDLEQISRKKKISVHKLLSRENMTFQPKLLHCTMKFIGKLSDNTRKDYSKYAENRVISHSMGKAFRVFVIGFVITERTLGARLHLPERSSWALWDQNDNEMPKPEASSSPGDYNDKKKSRPSRRSAKQPPSATTTAAATNSFDRSNQFLAEAMIRSVADDDVLLVDKAVTSDKSEKVSFLHPTFGFLSRTHLTCGVAPGVSPVQTGFDLIDMIKKEGDIVENNATLPENDDERTVMRFFGDGQCIVYLKEPIALTAIFTGLFQ